ncbi:MAG: hypothetical protein KKB51_09770 [Candidatus Riflebacteria bacterium]|nr:hypothetical protein [Candidatus Riflebacteria bacterium]
MNIVDCALFPAGSTPEFIDYRIGLLRDSWQIADLSQNASTWLSIQAPVAARALQ